MLAALPADVREIVKDLKLLPAEKRSGELARFYKQVVEQHAYNYSYPAAVANVLWVCLHCGFMAASVGPARILQHFLGAFGLRPSGSEMVRGAGKRVKPCSIFRLPREDIIALAHEGQPDARAVPNASGWPIPAGAQDLARVVAARAFSSTWSRADNNAAQRRHVLAIVCAAASFRSSEHYFYRAFYDQISEENDGGLLLARDGGGGEAGGSDPQRAHATQ